MNGSLDWLVAGLLRTTLVTSAAAVATVALLGLLRIRSAKLHRLAWLLVIAQGWCIACFTLRIEVERVVAPEVTAMPVEIPATSASTELWVSPVFVLDRGWNAISFATSWGPVVWGLGIALLILGGLARYVRVFAGGSPGAEPNQPEWVDEWEEVRRESRQCKAELRTTRGLGPLVCWVPWVFVVLVPRSLWSRLKPRDRRAILRHELAHCERGDLWKNLAVRLLALPQWFNPLVWLAVRRFEEGAEWACDELVARREEKVATEYASTLLRVADFATHVPCGAAGVSQGELSRRVKRLLQLPDKEVWEMKSLLVLCLLVAAVVWQTVRIERVYANPAEERATIQAEASATPPPRNGWFGREPYRIEPPDVLLIDAGEVAFKAPYRLIPTDHVVVSATGVGDERAPLSFTVTCTLDKRGEIDLGADYGRVKVATLSVDEAREAVRLHVTQKYPLAKVAVSLPKPVGPQPIAGEHLVGPDGCVNLGRYGSVYVTGMTLDEAKASIETQLSKFLHEPKVTVDVFAYNSKKYYIITRSADGDHVEMHPITGNETVLDALAVMGGLKGPANLRVERVARGGESHAMPVDYDAITRRADTTTNYQLWPGDRLVVERADAKKGASPAPAESVSPPPAYDNRVYSAAETAVPPVKATIRLIADPKRNLRRVGDLAEGPALVGETQLLVGFVETLTGNGLAEVLALPALVAPSGGKSELTAELREPLPVGTFAVELGNQNRENRVEFDARARLTLGEVSREFSGAFALSAGQSYLVRLNPVKKEQAGTDVYLMVTREEAD